MPSEFIEFYATAAKHDLLFEGEWNRAVINHAECNLNTPQQIARIDRHRFVLPRPNRDGVVKNNSDHLVYRDLGLGKQDRLRSSRPGIRYFRREANDTRVRATHEAARVHGIPVPGYEPPVCRRARHGFHEGERAGRCGKTEEAFRRFLRVTRRRVLRERGKVWADQDIQRGMGHGGERGRCLGRGLILGCVPAPPAIAFPVHLLDEFEEFAQIIGALRPTSAALISWRRP